MFMTNPYVALHYFFDGSIPAFASDKFNEISVIDDLVIGFWIIDMFLYQMGCKGNLEGQHIWKIG